MAEKGLFKLFLGHFLDKFRHFGVREGPSIRNICSKCGNLKMCLASRTGHGGKVDGFSGIQPSGCLVFFLFSRGPKPRRGSEPGRRAKTAVKFG